MTDLDLIDALAQRAMGWKVYDTSAHHPRDRAAVHAWRWDHPDGRRRLMVYDRAAHHNREWNPLASSADADELRASPKLSQSDFSGIDLATPEGRRALCEAAEAITAKFL